MAEEVNKQDQEMADSVAQFTETVDLEEIIANADVYDRYGQKVEKQPEQPEQTEQPKSEQPESAEESKPEQQADTKQPDQTVVSKPEGEELSEEHQLWRKAWENREIWEKNLKQKSQAIAKLQKLTPEQQEMLFAKIMPFVYGEEKIPETPDDVVKEAITKLSDVIPEKLAVTDTDGIEVTINRDQYEPLIQKTAGELIKRYLPELGSIRTDYQKLNDDYNQALQQANQLATMNGEIILDHFGQQYPESLPTLINDQERPSQALLRVMEAGEDHPEYYKILRCKAAAELRSDALQKGKNISFQQAYDTLYGTEYRKQKQQEQIKKELAEKQKRLQPERPGQAVQKSEADKVMDEVFGGKSHEELVNEFFK